MRWPLLLGIGVGAQLFLGFTSTPAPLLVGSMLAIAAFLYINRTRPGFPLTLTGLSLNLIVIGANGAMPVSGHALEKVALAGVPAGDLRHAVADGDTHLSLLGDVIPLGERVVSLGDLVMLVGLVWFLIATALSLVPPAQAPSA